MGSNGHCQDILDAESVLSKPKSMESSPFSDQVDTRCCGSTSASGHASTSSKTIINGAIRSLESLTFATHPFDLPSTSTCETSPSSAALEESPALAAASSSLSTQPLDSESLATAASAQCDYSPAASSSYPSTAQAPGDASAECDSPPVEICPYVDETQMKHIVRLIAKDLSEPYSIYTYRYFIHNWPRLCFVARVGDEHVGAIVCKIDNVRKGMRRGYIAMLAVDESVRRRKIGTLLVKKSIQNMRKSNCDEVVLETEVTIAAALRLYERLGYVRDKRLFRYYLKVLIPIYVQVVLETEVTNAAALRLYERLGFVRDKRLFRYYLNGVDAFRLKLLLTYQPLERFAAR